MLFARLVDDPSARPEEFPTAREQDAERARLFGLLEELVKWESSTKDAVLAKARAEILTVAKTTATSDIRSLVGRIANGEIRLPEIQRGYVWKPTQVATLIDSLYRNYPSGALLLWQTTEMPEQRPLGANALTAAPLTQPLYLRDGQQRLTSLYRVFTDDPRAQIVFNVEREAFQNHSAATA